MDDRVKQAVAEVSEYLAKDELGNIVVPVDLGQILEKYNLKAYNTTFTQPDVAGALDRKAKKIYVNRSDPQTRKIFTLAHELGHYFIHKDRNVDILYRERDNHDEAEREADHFAAMILIPEETIRVYWPIADGVQGLANIFGVSYPAMLNRLRDLRYV